MNPIHIFLKYKVQDGLYVRVMDTVGYNIARHVEYDVREVVEDIEHSVIINVKENITYESY